MAKQRQTDVNINFRVGSVDIQKATTQLNAAGQATDNLRKQTLQFGQQASGAYKFTSKAIEGMEQEVARLRQQVKLSSTQNVADVKRISDQYKSAKQQLDAYKKSLLDVAAATKQNAVANREVAASFGQVYSSVRLFLTAGIAKEILDISLNMAKLSGNVEGVSRAFQRIPGAELLLNDLRTATQGTVNDLQLMQQTLQAFNFGIDVQKLPQLLEFARVRAQQTGLSVDYLVNSIVSGIGRKSILILDNLGISAERLKQEFDGASIRAQNLGEVTRVVSKIAGEELDKMGGSIKTSATLVDQLTVSWHELGVEVSKSGTSTGFIGALKEAVDAMRLFASAGFDVKKLPIVLALEQTKTLAMEQVDLFRRRAALLKEEEKLGFTENELRKLEALNEEYEITKDLNDASIESLRTERQLLIEKNKSVLGLQKQTGETKNLIDVKTDEISRLEKTNEALVSNRAVLSEVIRLIVGYREAIIKANEVEVEPIGLIQAKMDQIEELEDRIKASRSRKELELLNRQMQILEGELRDLQNLGIPDNKFFSDIDKTLKPMEEVKKKTKSAVEELVNMDEILKEIRESINNLTVPTTEAPNILQNDFWDDLTQQIEENKRALAASGVDILADQLASVEFAEVESLNRRLEANRAFYDEQIALAGDNERRKNELAIKAEREQDEIRKKIAIKEWQAKKNAAVIDMAAGIAKNIAHYPYPFWIVPNLITTAKGLAEIAIINRNKPRFAKGVLNLNGPGTKTSDSIDAKLSRGESVMTADETSSSMGILKSIRARKLNDKVLAQIINGKTGGAKAQVFDDKRLLNKLDEIKNNQPDYMEHAGIAYKVINKGKDYKQRIRLSTMSK